MTCPQAVSALVLADRLALAGGSGEASGSIQALPSLPGSLRASLASLGSGCSHVMCKHPTPQPIQSGTVPDWMNFGDLNSHHGLLWSSQGSRWSTGEGVQRPELLSPNCHSLSGFVILGQSLLCSEPLFPWRMGLICPPHR